MNICLVALNASYSHTSLACRSLMKYCQGMNIDMCEYTINDRVEQITASLYKKHAQVYAFSCYIWNIAMVLEIAQRLKTVSPRCTVLLGGPEVSYDAQELLGRHEFIDYVICGEGEEALYAFASGKSFSDIQGFAYRENGKIYQNGRATVEDLSTLPRLYSKEELEQMKGKMVYYETSRGCPFSCSYCLSSTSHGVRFFPLGRVFQDLALFIESEVPLVKLVDRTFNIDEERTRQILNFIIDKGGNTCFHFEVAADLLTEEVIELLRSAPRGMFQLEIGVQSTNDAAIQAVERKTNYPRLAANVKRLREKDNIHLHLDLIAGLPYEKFDSFRKSFNDVYALRPHALQLGFLKLLKGSKIRAEAAKYHYCYTSQPPYEVLGNDVITFDELLSLKDIEDLVDKYHNSGAFEKSLVYAVWKYHSGAFEFFKEFSAYWEASDLFLRPHSRKELYDIFCAFFLKDKNEDDILFRELLKFDLLRHNCGASLPDWAEKSGGKPFYQAVRAFLTHGGKEKYLPHYNELNYGEMKKKIRVERFQCDVCGNGEICENVIIFDYPANKYIKILEKI